MVIKFLQCVVGEAWVSKTINARVADKTLGDCLQCRGDQRRYGL
jgi:hypothetical protein